MNRSMVGVVSLLAVVGLTSCATRHGHHRPEECPPPAWTQSPKANDSVNMYRIGTATGLPTAAAAREAAYQDAFRQMSQAISREAFGSAAGNNLVPLPLSSVEVLPGCSFLVQTQFGYDGWVQVSFPLAEKIKLLESLKSKNSR